MNRGTHWETFKHDADIGVRGSGATLAEAFAGAAKAMTAAICDPARVAAREAVRIACTASDKEMLLVDWLNALVYEMATRHLLFSRFEVTIGDRPAGGRGWRRCSRARRAPSGRCTLSCRASTRGVAEEAPLAYKDVTAVVGACGHAGLAGKVARLSPVICIKG